MAETDIRRYEIGARSTETFGRVLCNARNHHFIIDGPVQNGCPGEEVTPVEAFLASVAACGVELVQSLARSQSVPLAGVQVSMTGTMDRSRPVRPDLNLLNSVWMGFRLKGVDAEQAEGLVQAFKGR